jgi:hypothetical protein
MKNLFVFLFSLIVAASGVAAERTEADGKERVSILFIGNSFTFRHDLPLLVKGVLEEGQPGLSVHVERVVYGGQDMFRHWTYYCSQSLLEQHTITRDAIRGRITTMQDFLRLKDAPREYVHYWEVVRSPQKAKPFKDIQQNIQRAIRKHEALLERNPRTKWDYVVLQSWQDVYPDLDEGYAKYATKFAEVARQQGAQVILYITAPNIQNAKPVAAPLLQERVDSEMKLAHELAGKIDASAVVPVPLAINMIQQGGTDLTFCYVNDFHPNQTCAFLTANMFYAAIFKASPVGFAFDTVTETNSKGQPEGQDPDGGDAKVVFSGSTKAYLQKMAYESVQAFDQQQDRP